MPNDQKNINVLSTNQPDNQKRKRSAVDTSLTVSVWTIAGIVLAACSGGSTKFVRVGDGETTTIPGDVSGRDPVIRDQQRLSYDNKVTVKDGPIVGALVYVDVNGNGEIDDDDILLGETDQNGQVDFPAEHHGKAIIVKLEDEDGNPAIDTDNPNTPLTGEWMSLPSDKDGAVLVSPLTDLLARDTENNSQDLLDSIFGLDADGKSIVTISDILNPENYNFLRADLDATLIARAAAALARLQDDGTLIAGDDLLEQLQALFEGWREAAENDADFSDTLLTDSNLKNAVVAASRDALGVPSISDPNEGEPLTVKEDGSIRLRELEPDLLRGGDVRRFAAEKLFGFYDEQGNREEKPGIEGVFLRMESAPISVELAGGAEDKVVRVQFLLDDGSTVDLSTAVSTSERGQNPPGSPSGYVYVSAPNLHKLVFTPDANAHGEYEIEFLVYDGEEISAEEAPGTLVIEVESVNDLPEVPTITGDRDDATDGDQLLVALNGDIVGEDGTVFGILDVIDIETAVRDFTFRLEGTHGNLFTVDQSTPDDPRLRLKDGAERIETGQSYNIVVVAIDADGGESEVALTILQGGFYIETSAGRVYNNGAPLINEAFDAQDPDNNGVTDTAVDEEIPAVPATGLLGDQLQVTTNTAELASDANAWEVELRADSSLDGGGSPAVETEIAQSSETGNTIILVRFGAGATLDQIIAAVEAATGGVGEDVGDLITLTLQEGASGEDAAFTAAAAPTTTGAAELSTAGLGYIDDLFGANGIEITDTLPTELL